MFTMQMSATPTSRISTFDRSTGRAQNRRVIRAERAKGAGMATSDEIEAVNQAYGKAVANRDTAGVAALYASDAVLLPPNAPIANGRQAIAAVVQAYFD